MRPLLLSLSSETTDVTASFIWALILPKQFICYNSITDTGLLLSIHSHKIIWLVVSKTTDVIASFGWELPKRLYAIILLLLFGFYYAYILTKLFDFSVPKPTKSQLMYVSPAHIPRPTKTQTKRSYIACFHGIIVTNFMCG